MPCTFPCKKVSQRGQDPWAAVSLEGHPVGQDSIPPVEAVENSGRITVRGPPMLSCLVNLRHYIPGLSTTAGNLLWHSELLDPFPLSSCGTHIDRSSMARKVHDLRAGIQFSADSLTAQGRPHAGVRKEQYTGNLCYH